MTAKRFVVARVYVVIDVVAGKRRIFCSKERDARHVARELNKTAESLCLCGYEVARHFRHGRKIDCSEVG